MTLWVGKAPTALVSALANVWTLEGLLNTVNATPGVPVGKAWSGEMVVRATRPEDETEPVFGMKTVEGAPTVAVAVAVGVWTSEATGLAGPAKQPPSARAGTRPADRKAKRFVQRLEENITTPLKDDAIRTQSLNDSAINPRCNDHAAAKSRLH